MARRPEGGITRRKDGTYQGSIQVEGQRRFVYGRTRQEVLRKLAELRRQAEEAGRLADPGKRTVADLLDVWLEISAPHLKTRTLADYRKTCERYILPAIGQVRLDKLDPAKIQRLLTRLEKAGKHRTAQQVYLRLHQALKLAERWGWVPRSVCDLVDPPRHRPARRAVWTHEQLARFLEGTQGHRLYPLFLLALATGARLGELLALRWQDIDLQAGTARIERSVQRVAGRWVFSEPKTASGVRTVTLPAMVIDELKRCKAAQLQAGEWRGPDGLVFPGKDGGPMHQSTVQHAMRRLCAELGLPEMSPHGLKHLQASLLLSAGLPVPAVARRLGHSTPAVTMGVYAHALGGDDTAARLIGAALRAVTPRDRLDRIESTSV